MKAKQLAFLLFAVFLANSSSIPAAATGNPSAWTFTEITDENFVKAVDALPGIVQEAMDRTGVPGISVAVVRHDQVLLTAGYGVRLAGSGEPVNADTVFQLASLSKPIGATVVSRAVSEGAVAWDDPVRRYLPWFEIGDDFVSRHVTLEDLYSHRSGLPDHAGDHLEDLGFERKQILRKLRLLPLGPFRAQYAYTNFGLTAAAESVARANHTTWEDLSEDLLYQPAGMLHTSSRYDDYMSAANHATTHQRSSSGEWVPGPPRDPDPESPAGGVSSTANDMARWMQLQLGNGALDGVELIKSDVIQVMRQPRSFNSILVDPQARPSTYCLGLILRADGTGHAVWSHNGAFLLGAATTVTMIPAGDIGITVLTNGEPHGIPEAIAAEFVDIVETGAVQRDWLSVYQQAFDPFYVNPSELAGKDPPSNPTPSEPLRYYAGNYRNDYYGKASITIDDDGLVMALGPEPQYYRLQHWDGNVFAYYPRGENGLGITAVTFDPKHRTVTVENLDENGLGTFTMSNPHTRQKGPELADDGPTRDANKRIR